MFLAASACPAAAAVLQQLLVRLCDDYPDTKEDHDAFGTDCRSAAANSRELRRSSRLGRKRPGNLAGSAAAAIFILALAAGECTAGEVAAKPAAAVPIFLDTDVCVDAGDVAAITCLHGLADRGEANILGITCVTSCPYAPGCVDAVCRWCKRPNVPIGALKDRAFLAQSGYAKYMAQHWPNRYGEGAANVPMPWFFSGRRWRSNATTASSWWPLARCATWHIFSNPSPTVSVRSRDAN